MAARKILDPGSGDKAQRSSGGDPARLRILLALTRAYHLAAMTGNRTCVLTGLALNVITSPETVETTYGQPFDAYLRYYLGGAALVQGDADTAGSLGRDGFSVSSGLIPLALT
jgi:hypothetical protein